MKALIEKRNDLIEEMEGLVNKAKAETRAFDDGEIARMGEIKKEIGSIDATIKLEEESRGLEKMTEVKKVDEVNVEEQEMRAFVELVRENRANTLTKADNGVIVPTTIANRIIETVKTLSPILNKVSMYHVGGNLRFPKGFDLTAGYQTAEFAELVTAQASFGSIDLGSFVIGASTKISKSLLNNAAFDVGNYTIGKVAQALAEFLEKELIVGTASKMTGVLSATTTKNLATAGTLTVNDLIDAQLTVKPAFQGNAVWLMHPTTFSAVRKLQAAAGDTLVAGKIEGGFGYTLLGKEVILSESVPAITATAGAKSIVYGDLSGLYVNMQQNVEVAVLNEVYATQHAIGVVASVECDSKIVEEQKLVVVKNA
jgi:HK97 family phage major capsid protein